MRFNAYEIIRRAVEEGAAHGVSRGLEYFENVDQPPDPINVGREFMDLVEQEVMNALCAVINFSEREEIP